MKKSKDEVIEMLSKREIDDYGFIETSNGIEIFYVILDSITWRELNEPFIRYNIIDIQPWDDDIRLTLDNVIKDL